MQEVRSRPPRNSTETRARIIAAAQRIFSERGYAQATMREIAKASDVSHSLILRYYATKANLFGEALKASLDGGLMRTWSKSDFGANVIRTIDDPQSRIISPGMVALAIGDDEARGIAASVLAGQTMRAITDWLGGIDAEVRARKLLILALGYAICSRNVGISGNPATDKEVSGWMSQLLQGLVDGG